MSIATSYDVVPYPPLAFPYTHPSHLATVARLLGMNPAPANLCRVLELGCASGANLIPMAYAAAQSSFVGIDLSGRQIDEGQQFIREIGLRNATLAQMDICDAGERLADSPPFDYIIAHGIYSWIPDPVKDALLATCRRLLAPEGIAYVSYNCYPGCQARDMLREMTQYHGRKANGPREYAASGREFFAMLRQAMPEGDTAYRAVCRQQIKDLVAVADEVLLHDDLEGDNDPCYFHEFMAHADRHELGYVGDAYFGQMFGLGAEADALEKIRQAGDRRTFEQYLDFLFGRSLRATLLCHANRTPSGELALDGVRQLWASTEAHPVSADGKPIASADVRLEASAAVTFRGPESTVSLTTPLAKATLLELGGACPRPLGYRELLTGVAGRLKSMAPNSAAASDVESADGQLPTLLVEWFATRLIELHAFAPPMSVAVVQRPLASAVARYQAAKGWSVTNFFHRRIGLDGDLARQVIVRLDGQHDRQAILSELVEPVVSGKVEARIAGERITDPARIRAMLAERLETCLADLARHGLLEQPS